MLGGMPTDLPVRCACGDFGGVVRGVSARIGNRLVCYCDDCQLFAHFLGAPDTILDANGGTDIFQTSSARLEITRGAERLACMRLRRGGLMRWFAACCRTPVANTMATPGVPFMGMIHSCADHGSDSAREADLGPVRARVNGRFATGDRTDLDAHARAPVSLIARFARIVLTARLRGDHRRSPFFDAETGRPRVQPVVLDESELRLLESAREARG